MQGSSLAVGSARIDSRRLPSENLAGGDDLPGTPLPERFALRNVNRAEFSAEQPIGNEIPAERLAEYGRLMLEMAKENEAKQLAQQENNKLEATQ